MKILTGKQIREADKATVEREDTSSLDLMERAAVGIARWIAENIDIERRLLFCCGKGGNGGDGLAAARILADTGYRCAVFLGAAPDRLAGDARTNLARLPENVGIYDITAERPLLEPDAVIVDALLGVGATGEMREPLRGVAEWINSMPNRVISIDIPSGMATEWKNGSKGDGSCNGNAETVAATAVEPGGDSSAETGTATSVETGTEPGTATYSPRCIVRAETTLTIGFPKLALLLPETGEYAGGVVVIPIGLDEKFIAEAASPYFFITREWVERLRVARAKFSHKGDYGHALLVCGSDSMPGAAILATGGALRSGCGLVTTHVPEKARFALTANHPSAMLSLDEGECFSMPPHAPDRFSAIGVGCGLGRDPKTVDALEKLLAAASGTRVNNPTGSVARVRKIPMVLDADALNVISENTEFKRLIPSGSVLTPHPGELRRLVGEWSDEGQKLEKASKLAREIDGIVVIKGAHSVICTPDGRFIFNSTGTPGMAKGGSGDVLAGLITGLMARGYDAETASMIGVYNHGRAGERAAQRHGEEAMNASDLAGFI